MDRPNTDDPVTVVESCDSGVLSAQHGVSKDVTHLVTLNPQQIYDVVRTVPGGEMNVQEIYPLSPLQEGLLFHHLLNGGRDIYVLSTLLELQPRVRIGVFISALQKVIERHDILRTAMLWDGMPRPLQVVYRHATLSAEKLVLDPNGDFLAQLEEQLRPEQHGINVRQAPLLRLFITQDTIGGHRYALLKLHHMICDHQSWHALIAEVIACLEGREQILAAPAGYRDFVAWSLEHTNPFAAEAFFRRKLGSVTEPTVPFGVLEVNGNGTQFEEARQALGPELTSGIRAQSRRWGVSAARLFHAAWGLVVAHTSGQDEVVYGTVLLAADRGRTQAPCRLGLFVNTLPLKLSLRDITVKELIEQTHRELVELLRYKQTSLALAQRCSGVGGTTPLFTAVLSYRHSVGHIVVDPKSESGNVAGVRVLSNRSRTNYPITLVVDDLGDGFTLSVQTNPLIDAGRLLDYMITATRSLVNALGETPQRQALTLSILPDSERYRLVEGYEQSFEAYQENRTIHVLFEAQVRRTPGAIAVRCEGLSLTYAQLNGRANQLAWYLRGKGVVPDDLVGICVERSLEMIVGLLGILKAGGAYLPLDPVYPSERLAYMLQDASPRLLLILERQRSSLPKTAAEIVTLDSDWATIEAQPQTDLPLTSTPDARHLAYVIYTSGSTGRPKGVMVAHCNVTRLFAATEQRFNFNEADVWTLFHSFAFDFSVWELWGALLYGGRLVIVPLTTARSPQEFYRLLCKEAVTVLNQTPSMFSKLIEAQAQSKDKHALRVVIFGGETLELRVLRPWIARNGADHPLLVNMYGITETTVHVTYRRLMKHEIESERGSPIGSAIPDLKVYLLDRLLQPVAIGVAGEIYVGGKGIARGYLNRPDLTSERFIADPFGTNASARLYKTGDLGRWRPDGSIEHLGRNDHQVKIRGYRIELGEIEAQIVRHARIKDAAVIAQEDGFGQKRLVAYVVEYANDPLEYGSRQKLIPELRQFLEGRLPGYMLPAAWVTLETLPLTPNGKLDRKALPNPRSRQEQMGEYVPPRSELERTLADIWAQLLQIDQVGAQDNFFELGGHSLLIVQMVERLRHVGIFANVRSVYEASTLTALAAKLAAEDTDIFEVPPNLIQPECKTITPQMLPLVELDSTQIERIVSTVPGGALNVQDIYPLTPSLEGIIFHHLVNEHGSDPYARTLLFELSSREVLETFTSSLQSLIDRHDILRSAILWEGLPQPVQVVYRRATLPVESISLNESANALEQLDEHMRLDRQRRDLRKAPMLQLRIAADPNSGQWYALLQTHHMVFDNESLQVMFAELLLTTGANHQDLPKPEPYRNHVARALDRHRKLNAEAFFRKTVGDVDEPTAPFGLLDVRREGAQVLRSRRSVDADLVRQIHAQARRFGVSAATLFHAIWGLVVSRTSAREDLVFGSVLGGRLQSNTEPTVGMFINTLPIRLRLRGVTAEGLVEQTRHELTELLKYQQASPATAQRCSSIGGSAPLFTAILNYVHGNVNLSSEISNLGTIKLLKNEGSTNYPIVLSVYDHDRGFLFEIETDRRLDPNRLMDYVYTSASSLLQALANAPQTQALEVQIQPRWERDQILGEFNSLAEAYPQEWLIHELFEMQAARTPHEVAISHGGYSLTYSELNGRANQLARHLLGKGVGPGQLVAICVANGLETVVGLMGILKAGGAYVPLDPTYPLGRLQYILNDVAPRVLLIQEKLRGTLLSGDAQVVAIDSDWGEIANCNSGNIDAHSFCLTSRSVAYVIYTSGSTGKPKGVLVEHQSLVASTLARTTYYGMYSNFLLLSSFAFDSSVAGIFGTLAAGGRLTIGSADAIRDAPLLLDVIRHQSITDLLCVPSLFQNLLSVASDSKSFGELRRVIVAGEACPPSLLELAAQIAPSLDVYNEYGPTEATVWATVFKCSSSAYGSHVPIGRPIENTQIYILDASRRLVPIGAPGEIYIGGSGITRGYLNKPDLTAERFLPNPFDNQTYTRIYKTGDLARWRTDGMIEYLGRNDDQVKIRGYRIEPGEVESQLLRHPEVKQAAVLAREDSPGEKRLVAYVIPYDRSKPGVVPAVEELRAHMRALLPEYMVPSAFVILNDLPMTSNGKLDRRALPAPEVGAFSSGQFDAPEGEVEESLAGIFQTLLGLQSVGRYCNFFEIGGHSVLALRLLLKINQCFEVSLSVTDVYRSPTVFELASRIQGAKPSDEFVDLVEEASLNDDIRPRYPMQSLPSDAVLITGVTGFVGSFLLARLLSDTDVAIYCLVRSNSRQHAVARLTEVLMKRKLWRDEFERRLVVINGDVSLPKLGLDEATYKLASESVSEIYHCAASMNHLETYAMAKKANVEGSRELLRFSIEGRTKLVNHISTLSVFTNPSKSATKVVDESTSIEHEKHFASQGYVASKWVAEKIFMTGRERGIPCNIFRIGLVWADSEEGRYDEFQRECRIFKTCLMSGYGIRDYRYQTPPTPVDYVARAIVLIAKRRPTGGGNFHICSSGEQVENVFERCKKLVDAPITLLPEYDWIMQIRRLHSAGQFLPAAPLIESLFSMDREAFQSQKRELEAKRVEVDFDKTRHELELANLATPVWDEVLVRKFIEWMLATDEELNRSVSARASEPSNIRCA